MKKALNTSAIILALFFLQVPYSFGQERHRERPKRETNQDDRDRDNRDERDDRNDEGDVPQEEDAHVRKHNDVPRIALALESGAGVSMLSMGSTTTDVNVGGTIGAYADILMAGRFYVQPGLFYVMNGGSNVIISRINPYGHDTRINMIEVPVMFAYKTGGPASRARFTVGVGGYYGYNADADINGVRLRIGDGVNDDIRAMEFGVGLNVGVEIWNGLFFRIKAQRGLYDLQPDPAKDAIYTQSSMVTVGYLFGKKTRHYRRPPMRDRESDYRDRRM